DVGEQRGLELVDEQRAGRVHRPEADEAFADVELPHELHDADGQIHELDPLIGLNHDRLAVDDDPADLRRCHVFDRPLANGDGRALAHAVSSCMCQQRTDLYCLSVQEPTNVTQKRRSVATLLYSGRSSHDEHSDNLTLTPAATRSGCESH